jgi:hypothetical protein
VVDLTASTVHNTYMKEALKTIEAMQELVYQELRRVANDPTLDDKAYKLLQEATLEAIEVKRKIQETRGWMLASSRP